MTWHNTSKADAIATFTAAASAGAVALGTPEDYVAVSAAILGLIIQGAVTKDDIKMFRRKLQGNRGERFSPRHMLMTYSGLVTSDFVTGTDDVSTTALWAIFAALAGKSIDYLIPGNANLASEQAEVTAASNDGTSSPTPAPRT